MIFNAVTLKGVVSTGKRYILTDESRPGFCIKVSATGQAQFYYRRKTKGKRLESPLGRDFDSALSTYEILSQANQQEVQRRAETPPDALFIDPAYDLPFLCDQYLAHIERTLAASTVRNYEVFLDLLLEGLERTPTYWGHGTVAECRQSVKTMLRAKRDAGTGIMCNRMRSCYSSMFKWAVDEDICSDSPIYNMPSVPERPKDRYLEEHELAKFLPALYRANFNPRTCDALRLILLTGMRPGEVLGLQPEMVDLNGGRIILPETKNGRRHLIALSELAVELLREHVEQTHDTRRMFNVGIWGLRQVCVRASKKAGVKQISPHDLRRTFATLCGKLGADEQLIGKLLNHTATSVTARHYALYTYEKEKREACEKIADCMLDLHFHPAPDLKLVSC